MAHIPGEYTVMFEKLHGDLSSEEEAALAAVFNRHGKGEIADRVENARVLLITNADDAVAQDIRNITGVKCVIPNQTMDFN